MKKVHEILVPPKHVSPSKSGKIISASNKMKERTVLGGWIVRHSSVNVEKEHHGFFSMTEAHKPLCSFKNRGF